MFFFFKKYKHGDFSFIKNKQLQTTLTFDYTNCYHLISEYNESYFEVLPRRSNSFDRENPPNIWDTPPGEKWKSVLKNAYPCHCRESYHFNMKILYFIYTNGWEQLLESYKKKLFPFI
jgi:hypothetical protein